MNEWEEKRREELTRYFSQVISPAVEIADKIIYQEKEIIREAFKEFWNEAFIEEGWVHLPMFSAKGLLNKILQSKDIGGI